MENNIDQQLDDAITFLNDYWPLYDTLRSERLVLTMFRNYPRVFTFALSKRRMLNSDRDILSGKTSELGKELILLLATEKEKESPAFEAFTSDYSIDYISRKMEEKLNDVDFGKIKQLHDSKKQSLEFNAGGMLGVILGASSLVLKTVPQKVVIDTFDIEYADFEVGVFWFTMAVIGYVSIIILLAWGSTRKNSRKHKFIAQILEYTSIRKGTS